MQCVALSLWTLYWKNFHIEYFVIKPTYVYKTQRKTGQWCCPPPSNSMAWKDFSKKESYCILKWVINIARALWSIYISRGLETIQGRSNGSQSCRHLYIWDYKGRRFSFKGHIHYFWCNTELFVFLSKHFGFMYHIHFVLISRFCTGKLSSYVPLFYRIYKYILVGTCGKH